MGGMVFGLLIIFNCRRMADFFAAIGARGGGCRGALLRCSSS
jgi:hypothetical protein